MFYKFFPFLSSVRLIINLFDANQMSSFQNMSDFFFFGGGGGEGRGYLYVLILGPIYKEFMYHIDKSYGDT